MHPHLCLTWSILPPLHAFIIFHPQCQPFNPNASAPRCQPFATQQCHSSMVC